MPWNRGGEVSFSVSEARSILERLGVNGHQSEDGRTYFAVPYTHSCGQTSLWVVVIDPREGEEVVKSLGMHCGDCKITVVVPLNRLRSLAAKPLLDEIDRMAETLKREMEGNEPWFKDLIAGRFGSA
jgi:hypothetical protein